MDYIIKIEDMLNLEDELILHYAERGTVSLNSLGGSDLSQPLVGHDLTFSLEVFGAADAKYSQYFTSDEKRFRVTKEIVSTGEIVFRGYLLPESYTEPYDKALFYVNFSAVDGIGLLKGKLLPPDFYSAEKTVIEVISECLQLTKVDFDIYLTPAIENHLKRNWKDVLLDTAHYYDEQKPPFAYDFLSEIIGSMQCQLFQSKGRWKIEGINKRHLVKAKFWKYSITGEYLGTVDLEKEVKKIRWLSPAPQITMVPAATKVIVTQSAPSLNLPTEVYQENKLVGIPARGVDGSFFPKHWNFVNYFPKMQRPEYFLSLPMEGLGTAGEVFNEDLRIELKRKPFVLKGTKIRIKMAFQFVGLTSTPINQLSAEGKLLDMQPYRISLNGNSLFFNINTAVDDASRLVFDANGNAKKNLEFVAAEDGYLNIELFRPIKRFSGFFGELLVNCQELNIEEFNEQEDLVYIIDLVEESSVVKEIELEIADDYSQNSKCFYLEKVRELAETGGAVVEIPILYGRQQNGKNYSIVSLKGAKLIDQYPTEVSWNVYTFTVNNPKVIYNLNGGDEMAIETENFYDTGKFYVNTKPFKNLTISRLEWLKWTDSIYQVQQKRYGQVVAEINAKLYAEPHLKIDGLAENPLKFDDLIEFTYNGQKKYFVITDLNWNPAEGESQVTMIEGIYDGGSQGNIVPYVYAGPDLFLTPAGTSVQITDAVVNDPDGQTPALLWTKLDGDAGESFGTATSLNPLISGLTGNTYTFQIAATDDQGAVVTDTMNVYRKTNYLLLVNLLSTKTTKNRFGTTKKDIYSISFAPAIPVNEQVIIDFKSLIVVNDEVDLSSNVVIGGIYVSRNDVLVYSLRDSLGYLQQNRYEDAGSISYTAGDTMRLGFEMEIGNATKAEVLMQMEFIATRFQQAPFNSATNIPVKWVFNLSTL